MGLTYVLYGMDMAIIVLIFDHQTPDWQSPIFLWYKYFPLVQSISVQKEIKLTINVKHKMFQILALSATDFTL